MTKQNLIFISHAHIHAELAILLKKIILDIFPMASVFVSSDDKSIDLGDKWLDKVNESLKSCEVMFVLLSKDSIHRSWIAFETGVGWAKGIKVVPICFDGLLIKDLPLPFSQLSGVNIEQSNSLARMMRVINDQFSYNVTLTNIDFNEYAKKIREVKLN